MRRFKHYIITRFNAGLYSPKARIHVPSDEWMRHRIKLFMTFTLPSIMGQSCQNFTWLVLMDKRTPKAYIEMLECIQYPNMQLIYTTWLRNIEPGDYDLITTRIDNDDAFHPEVIKVIQDSWYEQRPEPWVLVFPFGFILDLATKQVLFMEYRVNNCPTLIENALEARTIWHWEHTTIPAELKKRYISDQPYWLQVVHSQNLKNRFPGGSRAKIIHRDLPVRLDYLNYFGIDTNNLPNL